jgi:uncharacterized protein
VSFDSLFPLGFGHYFVGGLLVGSGASLIFIFTGAVSGMSTVFSSSWSYLTKHPFFRQSRFTSSRGWRLVLAIGLMLGAMLWWQMLGPPGGIQTQVPWWRLLAGGFLIGLGARLSNGCTSGHGICGLASLQLPSLIAVLTFLTTAMAMANLVAVLGGTP